MFFVREGVPFARLKLLPQSPVVRSRTTRASGTRFTINPTELFAPIDSCRLRYNLPAGYKRILSPCCNPSIIPCTPSSTAFFPPFPFLLRSGITTARRVFIKGRTKLLSTCSSSASGLGVKCLYKRDMTMTGSINAGWLGIKIMDLFPLARIASNPLTLIL